MIEVKITGATAADVYKLMHGFIAGTTISTPAVSEASHDKAAEAATQVQAEVVETTAPKRTRKPKAEKLPEGPALNIRANPEQREPAATVEAAQDDAAQDEADEQPEQTAGPKVYTVDDVRNSAVKYREKFGVAEVQEDLVKLLTEKAGVAKISALQSTPAEDLQAICFAIEVAIDSGKRYGA